MRSFRDGFSRPLIKKQSNKPIPRSFQNGFDRPLPMAKQKINYYNFGNEYTSRTGGWVNYYRRSTPVFNNNVDNLEIISSEPDDTGIKFTDLKVDLTDISTLYFLVDHTKPLSGDRVLVGISSSKTVSLGEFDTETDLATGTGTGQLVEVDVSGYSGDYYIGFGASNSSSGSGGDVIIKVYRVYGK